jgi:hypothetical protein
MKHSRLIVLGASLGALSSLTGPLTGAIAAGPAGKTAAPHAKGVSVNVRVEGMRKTLLNAVVDTRAQSIDPDGKPADTCEGVTAGAALQEATKGQWTAGSYFSGLGYPVVGIFGESYPFTSAYYWSFWVDGKVASAGICTTALHPKERLLFFPQCSKESAAECPDGLFDPAVLEVKGPARARTGKAIVIKVLSRANLTGKPSPGAGVTVSGGGHAVTTGASGTAKVRFAKAGRYRIVVSRQGAIRDELTVTVRR